MREAAGSEHVTVEVAHAPAPRQVVVVRVVVPAGAPVREVVVASGLAAQHPDIATWLADPATAPLAVSIWGRRATPDQPVRERDRIELLRPLTVDPKEARRQRYRRKLSGSPS
jgi:putative ubiquitin-RnfH superfamily antitoxin RatB of RatAB toxin-antitoxin module